MVTVIATLKLIDNQLEALKQVVQELQEFCIDTETGMLQYDWYLSEEDQTIKVIEVYKDSEAVNYHFDNYKPFSPKLNSYRSFISMEIFGEVSTALRNRVRKANAIHYQTISRLKEIE